MGLFCFLKQQTMLSVYFAERPAHSRAVIEVARLFRAGRENASAVFHGPRGNAIPARDQSS